MVGINFSPKSLLGFLTAVSFLAWLGGTYLKTYNDSIGTQIANIGFPVFVICFAIWLIFIFITIARNVKSF